MRISLAPQLLPGSPGRGILTEPIIIASKCYRHSRITTRFRENLWLIRCLRTGKPGKFKRRQRNTRRQQNNNKNNLIIFHNLSSNISIRGFHGLRGLLTLGSCWLRTAWLNLFVYHFNVRSDLPKTCLIKPYPVGDVAIFR